MSFNKQSTAGLLGLLAGLSGDLGGDHEDLFQLGVPFSDDEKELMNKERAYAKMLKTEISLTTTLYMRYRERGSELPAAELARLCNEEAQAVANQVMIATNELLEDEERHLTRAKLIDRIRELRALVKAQEEGSEAADSDDDSQNPTEDSDVLEVVAVDVGSGFEVD